MLWATGFKTETVRAERRRTVEAILLEDVGASLEPGHAVIATDLGTGAAEDAEHGPAAVEELGLTVACRRAEGTSGGRRRRNVNTAPALPAYRWLYSSAAESPAGYCYAKDK